MPKLLEEIDTRLFNLQLQQCPVGIAVREPVLALLCQVRLQAADGLGVVTLETIDDGRDLLRPLCWVFAAHVCGVNIVDERKR